MKLLVHSRAEIEAGILVRSTYVLISIHDPDKPRPKVKLQSALRDTLTLAFHDTEPSSRLQLPPDIQPFTPAHAAQIRDFVRKHHATVGAIVVHCEQGMSRSPAVAAAIADALHLDPRPFHQLYTPNQHVYHTLLDAFESPPTPSHPI